MDIGSGAGFPIIELAQRLGNTCHLWGIDPWEGARKRIEQKMQQYGIDNVTLITGVAESLDFEDNFFDLLVSNNGINNVDDLEKVLEECSRVCKPGGQFVFTFNQPDSFYQIYGVIEKCMLEMGEDDVIEKIAQHIFERRKAIVVYDSLLRRNGFRINGIDEGELIWSFVDGTTLLNHYSIRMAFRKAWGELVEETKEETFFDLLEEELNMLAEEKNGLRIKVPFATIDCQRL